MSARVGQADDDQGVAQLDGVWVLYDGDCPMCRSVAQALRIRRWYGSLHLVDARQSREHPLYRDVTRRGLSLDEGMVILADGQVFHGKDALTFVARFGDPINPTTILSTMLFRAKVVAATLYPVLRGCRNLLLAIKGVGQIDNLNAAARPAFQPTFQPVFGDAWPRMPDVFHRHYANWPFSDDMTVVEGVMDIACHGPMRWLAPVINRMGQIPAMNVGGVAVRDEYRSDPATRAFHFRRIFSLPGGRVYEFRSRMLQVDGAEMVEIMRFGLCWRFRCGWDGEKVVLSHRGYGLSVFGIRLPLPLGLLIGRSDAEETAVDNETDDDTFDMVTRIVHPWWGLVYEYKGRFTVTESP